MNAYGVNLARDVMATPARRKALYVGMLIYLALAGAALAAGAYFCTLRWVETMERFRQTRTLEAMFAQEHAGAPDVLSYAETLNGEMEAERLRLQAVRKHLGDPLHLPTLLSGLREGLPKNAWLMNVALLPEQGKIVFDMAVPIERNGSVPSPDACIGNWAQRPELARQLFRLRSSVSKRHVVDGADILVLRFEADRSQSPPKGGTDGPGLLQAE